MSSIDNKYIEDGGVLFSEEPEIEIQKKEAQETDNKKENNTEEEKALGFQSSFLRQRRRFQNIIQHINRARR